MRQFLFYLVLSISKAVQLFREHSTSGFLVFIHILDSVTLYFVGKRRDKHHSILNVKEYTSSQHISIYYLAQPHTDSHSYKCVLSCSVFTSKNIMRNWRKRKQQGTRDQNTFCSESEEDGQVEQRGEKKPRSTSGKLLIC